MKKKLILHIDMDYFFAQIEERENKWLKDKIIVVGANPKKGRGRGVVSTCNYKAREYGIKSGMPISRAYKIAPHAVFLPVNMSYYEKISRSIFNTIRKTLSTKDIEEVALDEAYINITNIAKNLKQAIVVGSRLKSEIFKKESLTCTIGISENKMLAKIACNMVKPNGIYAMSQKMGEKAINEMSIRVVPGIGPKTEKIIGKYLNKNNLKINDVKHIKERELIDLLGKRGSLFYNNFQGIDYSELATKKEVKSIGKEYTFSKNKESPKEIISSFTKLVKIVEERLLKNKRRIKTIIVTCRFDDFKKKTKQKEISFDSYNKNKLYKESVPLLLDIIMKNNKKIRLIGLRVILK